MRVRLLGMECVRILTLDPPTKKSHISYSLFNFTQLYWNPYQVYIENIFWVYVNILKNELLKQGREAAKTNSLHFSKYFPDNFRLTRLPIIVLRRSQHNAAQHNTKQHNTCLRGKTLPRSQHPPPKPRSNRVSYPSKEQLRTAAGGCLAALRRVTRTAWGEIRTGTVHTSALNF